MSSHSKLMTGCRRRAASAASRSPRGDLIIDKDWDEPLLDISVPAKRAALMEIIGPWPDGCAAFDECQSYIRTYGGRVFDIEYTARDFAKSCATWANTLSITLRDRDVRPSGQDGYVYRHC